jgi:hypothetical protein
MDTEIVTRIAKDFVSLEISTEKMHTVLLMGKFLVIWL